MKTILDRDIEEARRLPVSEQDAIGELILARIADDRAWDESFARSPDLLAGLAQRAREDAAAGRVRRLSQRRT